MAHPASRAALAAALVAMVSVVQTAVAAQPTRSFKIRLTPVPIEARTASAITGKGSATATVSGTTLTISGTFEGMQSAATDAKVHIGGKGIRGPSAFDLTITKAPSGSFSGTMMLTRVQVDSLERGWFYVQIDADKAPDGNLWGWLVP